MNDLQEIIGDYEIFIDDILESIDHQNFDINDFSQIDHLCYRTVSPENYEQKKLELDSVANLVAEVQVNGRDIATYRLIEPIFYDIWRIDAIELPAPKPESAYTEGLEHLEFVIYDDFQTFLAKYQGKQFDLKSVERGINPEIGLNLGTYSVKFHLLSLLSAIYIEHKIGIEEIND